MDSRTKLENIRQKIEALLKLIEINQGNHSLHAIDRDIILNRLRNLYEDVLFMNTSDFSGKDDHQMKIHDTVPSYIDDILENRDNVDNKVQKAIENIDREEEVEEPVEAEDKTEAKSKVVIVKSKAASDQMEEIELEPEKIEQKEIKEELKEEVSDNDLADNIIHKEYNHEDVKTIADKFEANSRPTLNEILGNKQKARDLASQYTDKPIHNLKASISINDKIWFIKELFDGDTDLYNDTLKMINEMKDLDEALSYLNKNFDWDQQNDSFQSFLELLFRRFLPDEMK